MIKISTYQNSKSYNPIGEVPISEIFKKIKDGGYETPVINTLRLYEKGSEIYDSLKNNALPTYRFNFSTNGLASNANLGAPTGLIYLDVDSIDSISNNSYVYASWKSPSKTGYAVLVKVEGLSLSNFKDAYDYVGTILGVTPDPCARKAIQQTCLSYDPDIYINQDSTTVYLSNLTKDNKKGIIPSKLIKEKKDIGRNDTFLNKSVRFSNIDEYFTGQFKDAEYRVFKDKVDVCNPIMPRDTPIGKRHTLFYTYMTQVAVLNYMSISRNYMSILATSVNRSLDNPMDELEVKSISDSVYTQMKEGKLTIFYNEKRRILFNPSLKMSQSNKMGIVNREVGKLRTELTIDSIYNVIENWDFSVDKKITIKLVSKYSGKSQATIKRHWKNFKNFVADLNKESKNNTYLY